MEEADAAGTIRVLLADDDALFLSVHSRVEDWPPHVEYLD